MLNVFYIFFFFQAEDGIRDTSVTGVQTCALPISILNNDSTESLGVAVGQNGNVMVGWEDDGDGLKDAEGVWTLLDSTGASLIRSEERRVGKECGSRLRAITFGAEYYWCGYSA